MTDKEVMQQALKALEDLQGGCTDSDDGTVEAITVWCPEVITALRKALEQPEQEPHSYCYVQQGTSVDILTFDDQPQDAIAGTIYPLYAAPPAAQRTWVGLTPEEVKHLYPYGRSVWGRETFEAIEKALKDKNT